jgi:hypothetical protein
LIKTTRARSWVAAYRDVLPDTVATCIDLESYACRVRHYAAGMMPDLLQHEGYTQIRIHRQAILTRQPVTATFEFILDEAVLRRAIGEPSTMTEQLRRLGQLADLPNVTIRVVPYRAGMHPGLETNSFEIMEFPTDSRYGGLPTTVYVGRLGEHVLLDKPEETGPYEASWDDICAPALDEMTSRTFIGDLVRELERRSGSVGVT